MPIPVAAVLAVVIHDGAALLVQRKNPPDAGLWGFPGGKIEAGETLFQAAQRELLEETGIHAQPCRVLDSLDSITRDTAGRLQFHFVLTVVQCRWQSGLPRADDDALDAKWVPLTGLAAGLPLSAGVIRIAQMAQDRSGGDDKYSAPNYL